MHDATSGDADTERALWQTTSKSLSTCSSPTASPPPRLSDLQVAASRLSLPEISRAFSFPASSEAQQSARARGKLGKGGGSWMKKELGVENACTWISERGFQLSQAGVAQA